MLSVGVGGRGGHRARSVLITIIYNYQIIQSCQVSIYYRITPFDRSRSIEVRKRNSFANRDQNITVQHNIAHRILLSMFNTSHQRRRRPLSVVRVTSTSIYVHALDHSKVSNYKFVFTLCQKIVPCTRW